MNVAEMAQQPNADHATKENGKSWNLKWDFIGSIMRLQVQGNAAKTVRIGRSSTTAATDMMLADGGANVGLAGENMLLIEEDLEHDTVDVIGVNDHIAVKNAQMGTYATIVKQMKMNK